MSYSKTKYAGTAKNNIDLFLNQQLEIFEQANNNAVVLVSNLGDDILFCRKSLSSCSHSTGTSRWTSMTARRERLDQYAFSKTELSIKENGSLMRIKKIEEACRYGLMEADTMASGEMEWPMGREDSFMPKVMSTKESGLMTKQMATECTLTSMEAGMKDNGSKTSNMGSELNSGLMVLSTKDNTNKE